MKNNTKEERKEKRKKLDSAIVNNYLSHDFVKFNTFVKKVVSHFAFSRKASGLFFVVERLKLYRWKLRKVPRINIRN